MLEFKIERTDEQLTAHGGLALLAEYNHGMGLRELSDRHLTGPGSNRGYAPSVFVDSLVLLLQAGGQSLEDLRELEQEAGLRKRVGRDQIPDPDTVGDGLRSACALHLSAVLTAQAGADRRMGDPQAGQAGLHGLGQVRDLLNQRILRRDKITEYTLDVDATQIEAENQEAQWTYQGVKGYMPMLGFLFETPVCLSEEFREGRVSPGSGQLSFYRGCKARMPAGKRIAYYRADSASYQAELINELEANGVYCAITADQDRAERRRSAASLRRSGRSRWSAVGRRWPRRCTPWPAPTLPFVWSSNGSYAASRICLENKTGCLSWGSQQWALRAEKCPPGLGMAPPAGAGRKLPERAEGWFGFRSDALWAELCPCRLFPNRGDRLPSFPGV